MSATQPPEPPVAGDPPERPARSRPGVLRRPLFWAVLVLVVWWVVASVGGPLAGRLQEVQTNDNAAFLPASAESTEVNTLQQRFAEAESFPVVVLFVRDAGLTPGDVTAATRFTSEVASFPLTDEKGTPYPDARTVGDYLTSAAPVGIPSKDGKAYLTSMALDATSISESLSDGTSAFVAVAETLQYQAGQVSPGLDSYVTGIGGIFADEFKVFGSLDTTLLGITGLVVAVILILVYRSPVLWVIPLLTAVLALSAASGVVYVLAKNDVLTLNGQAQGILTVLVFGAATDYALLLVARYREELHLQQSHFVAMRRAWLGVVEPLAASAATVCIGLLCLLFSELNSNKSTGPVAAIGIVCALLAALTILPAMLVVPGVAVFLLLTGVGAAVLAVLKVPFLIPVWALLLLVAFVWGGVARSRGGGPSWMRWSRWPVARWVFWPRIPVYGAEDEKLSGLWARMSGFIARRARMSWVLTTLALLVGAFFLTTLKADGLSIADSFSSTPRSVTGQQILQQHFPGGSGNPAVVVANADQTEAVTAAAQKVEGVTGVVPYTGSQQPGGQPKVVDGLVLLQATLADPADSDAAQATVAALREAVHAVPGAEAKVGGFTAINYDTQQSSQRDRRVIIPIVLVVILLVLMLLLRALVAPVLLMLTVLLSFAATLGVCALVFNHVLGFAGADSSFPLFAFVFLVALGVDYNIFLMTRVREESQRNGTRRGILRGLTVTGGVITSAGLVLAATFSVLGTLPLVFLAEIGFAVAFGVLLDTLVVRTFLVPALMYDVGRPIWWPSRLARAAEPPEPDRVTQVSEPVG